VNVRSFLCAALLTLTSLAAASNVVFAGPMGGGPNTTALATVLASLNLARPAVDLDANLKRGDKRFIGFNGYTCIAPGVDDDDATLLRHFGVRCLVGTSDAIEGTDHAALLGKAAKYAREYNAELLRRIHAGLVT
jgi:hypothetical protein